MITRLLLARVADDANKYAPGMNTQQLSGLGQDVAFVQRATETEFVEFTSRFGNQDIWSSVRTVKDTPFGKQLSEEDQFRLGTLILRGQGLGDEFALQALVDDFPGITKLMIQANAVRRARGLDPDASVGRPTV